MDVDPAQQHSALQVTNTPILFFRGNKVKNAKINIAMLTIIISLCNGCFGPSSNMEEATGKGSISGFHAISDLGPVNFLIEEVVLASIDYKQDSGITQFDDLTFNFNFDILLPGEAEFTRLATRETSVVADMAYTFILTGSLANPEILLWEQLKRDWQAVLDDAADNGTDVTILDVAFGHLATNVGDLDIYLSAPGLVPVLGNQIATVTFGGLQESIEIESGEYQLIVTSVGAPDNFLFASEPFALAGALSVAFVVMSADESGTSDYDVRVLGSGTGAELVDINAISTMRVVHGANNTGALDVIVGDQFSTPFASGIAFGDRSAPAEIASGNLSLNITPAGNPGSFLAEEEISLLKDERYSLYLTGLPGQLVGFLLGDSARRLSTHALLRVYQGAARLDTLDFYLVPTGSDIALLSPSVPSLAYTGATGFQLVTPGIYDLVFTLPGTKTIVAGPLRQDLNALGIYDGVTTDSAQTDIADLLFFSDE